jgi:glycosyltransferase involved in cell wall biosynthesis
MSATSVALDSVASQPQATSARRPLRVLQVIASVADVNGGASTAVWATLKALKSRDIHCELVTTNEDGPRRLMDVPMGSFIRQGGHRVRYFPSRGDRYTTSWPLAKWLFAHVRDYDLIHVHGLFRFAPVAAAHAALIRGVPYVLTLHNTLGEWGMQYRRPLLKKLSIGLLEGRILDRASRVHLCSVDELSQAMRVRPLGGRSSVFPLGIDFADVGPEGSDPPGGFNLDRPAGHPVVLFMSRIHEIKGLDRLLAAFVGVKRARPDAVLAIAGTGDTRLLEHLQDTAQELGIAECTYWLGFVQGRRKQELLSRASAFVLPSHSENFGYAVVEAVLAGVLVVTTGNVPAGRFVSEAEGGIICDGTPAQLEPAILQVLSMPEEARRRAGTRAAAMLRERLSLENYGESLERIYRETKTGQQTTVPAPD